MPIDTKNISCFKVLHCVGFFLAFCYSITLIVILSLYSNSVIDKYVIYGQLSVAYVSVHLIIFVAFIRATGYRYYDDDIIIAGIDTVKYIRERLYLCSIFGQVVMSIYGIVVFGVFCNNTGLECYNAEPVYLIMLIHSHIIFGIIGGFIALCIITGLVEICFPEILDSKLLKHSSSSEDISSDIDSEDNEEDINKQITITFSILKDIKQYDGIILICGICSADFEDNDRLRTLKCGHYFHSKCIELCPFCADKIIVDTDTIEI